MPVKQGQDKEGHYYRWGSKTKYYFDPKDKRSRDRAKEKARRQGLAIRLRDKNDKY